MSKHVCKGCLKPILIPGFCSPKCAQKAVPVKKAIDYGDNLMGPCARCGKDWGALHYIKGKPVYYHVKSQGGCVGVAEWVSKTLKPTTRAQND